VTRTTEWDEFPNGRWGDSRSPAYGELDGYGIGIKHTTDDAIRFWGYPTAVEDLCDIFAKFVHGDIRVLPWCDQPLMEESAKIRDRLELINRAGFLTINSQPAVNGARSDSPVYGWGPKNGYVYQKAYLEFFVSPEALPRLLARIDADPLITYHAVSRDGVLQTNTEEEVANAVTWGVFPGQEIAQPTIVEALSFLAWKDEAFQLWDEWAKVYDRDSPSAKLISDIASTWHLMNIVHNDYHDSNRIYSIFKSFNGNGKHGKSNGS